jgi:hypothetical protein
MTILIKGQKVTFQMADGRNIVAPARAGMMHDPEGQAIPYCQILVGPYQKTNKPVELTSEARNYFGSDYPGRAGSVDFPAGPWKPLGEVRQILYQRTPGSRHEGNYFHPFKKKSSWGMSFKQAEYPTLSKCGSFYRLELPSGCTVNWRGFVNP